MFGLMTRKNKVPEHQKFYQTAYRNHERVWKINPRSRYLLTPYLILLWGTTGCTIWMMGRTVMGRKTWFGKD
ncbi:hypothetical protein P8C59_006653 [Phyllachora maydis]|uniref:Uncharacterized protein n=1 Tax=Phyllachora maydis TaxID=1825666 RepID=A0AAD9I6V1_9PEZI|nr:hypothetical protein P8C59_006653 [Phyllachora maydis]